MLAGSYSKSVLVVVKSSVSVCRRHLACNSDREYSVESDIDCITIIFRIYIMIVKHSCNYSGGATALVEFRHQVANSDKEIIRRNLGNLI